MFKLRFFEKLEPLNLMHVNKINEISELFWKTVLNK